MTFGEKVKSLRKKHGLSQPELAQAIGVSVRTIASYEAGRSYPKVRDMYDRLARVFGVDVNYLKTENEEFFSEVSETYGLRGQKHARNILEQSAKLLAGGELSEEDADAFMLEMNRLFWDSKERAKKYTPRKYLKVDGSKDE